MGSTSDRPSSVDNEHEPRSLTREEGSGLAADAAASDDNDGDFVLESVHGPASNTFSAALIRARRAALVSRRRHSRRWLAAIGILPARS